MAVAEHIHFERLKTQVVIKMQRSHPEIPSELSDWRGQDIMAFQVDLRETQNEHISEKWFYTHMKSSGNKLPRIDTLNLLSRYVGYKNWADFSFNHDNRDNNSKGKTDKSNRVFLLVPALVMFLVIFFYMAVANIYNKEYNICFIDGTTEQAILDQRIDIAVMVEGESPAYYTCDESGCFSIIHNSRSLEFVVETNGYQTDTIVRMLNKFNRNEIIRLRPED